jgi:hypothetical protein
MSHRLRRGLRTQPPTTQPPAAAAWFDALPPIDPPGFENDHPGWCRRHYAPAVRLGGNQCGATMALVAQLMVLVRDQVTARGAQFTAAAYTEFMDSNPEFGAACCIIGDDRMYTIWANWLPA